MNLPWRIALYVVLAVAAVFFTQRFFASVNRDMQRVAARYERADADASALEVNPQTANSADEADQTSPRLPTTPDAPLKTNAPASGGGSTRPASAPAATDASPRKGLYAALALFSVISLGLMVGREVSAYIGHRVQREIYGEASEPVGDADYDEAERVWADGDHLEAIRLLREFLQKKPNKLHAAFRIAEIYEKDMGNHLAAALEYEEILKHRFDRQRWAWAAIHLVNLYNRVGQAEKAEGLLHRIADDYSETDAAAKARQHLGLPEPSKASAADLAPSAETAPADDGGFKLPPGFRPK